MILVHTLADYDRWRVHAGACVIVPTMGALHAGHAALISQAVSLAGSKGLPGGCVVTVFVNPTQFNEAADYQRYPRTLESDAAICRDAGASCLFAPETDDVYPPGAVVPPPPLPDVATRPGLEDRHRPGHFAGVCQVVRRLFEMSRPDAAVFGEKDWQQLRVVTAMTRGLGLSVDIVPGATVREADGLAMSSRNRFLSASDRRRGLALYRALRACQTAHTPDDAEAVMHDVLGAEGIEPEYAVVRDSESLIRKSGTNKTGSWRALIAARVGTVRLIDNSAWGRAQG